MTRKGLAALAGIAVSVLAGAAWAVEPVAAWDGFATLEPVAGYAFAAGDGIVDADGVATIAEGKVLTLEKNLGTRFSVVMEVSDIPGAAGNAFCTILDLNLNGYHLSLDSQEGSLMNKWNHGGDWGATANATPISGRNVIAYVYNGGDRVGEDVYVNGRLVVHGGAFSQNTAITRLMVGGYIGSTPFCTANGMKVHRLALYDALLSAEDIAEITCSSALKRGDAYVCSTLGRAETKSSHYTQSANVNFVLPPSGDCPAGTVVSVTKVKLGSPVGKSMAAAVTLAGQQGAKGAAETSETTGYAYVQPYVFATPVEIEVGKTYTFNAGGSQCTGIRDASPIAGNNMAAYSVYCAVEGTVATVIRKGTVARDCTLDAVAWENGAPAAGDRVELNVTGDATLTLDSAVDYASLKITGEGALAIADPENLGTTPVEGDGTLVFDGDMPSAALRTSFQSDKWSGIVWVKNLASSAERSPSLMGNAASTVRYTNVTGWMTTAMKFDGTVELADDENGRGLTIDNGSSGWQDNRVVRFGHLKGSGTLSLTWSKTFPLHLPDMSEFSGSVNCASASGIGVIVGASAPVADGASGSVTILAGATAHMAADKAWTFANGKGIGGAGRLVVEGQAPAEFTADPVVTLDASWTGTVELKNLQKATGTNWGVLQLNKYGNANSTVALNNVTMTAYAVGSSNNGNTAENNVGAYEVMAGGWNLRHGDFSSTDVYRGDLKGGGTITVTATGGSHGQIVFCGNPEGFTGTIAHGSQAKAKRVAFLAGKTAAVPANSTDYRTVFFGDGVTLPHLTTASPVVFGSSVVVRVDAVPPELVGTKVLSNTAASESTLDVQVSADVAGAESSAYSLYQKTDGIYLVNLSKVVWAGASGTALDGEGAWADGAVYGDNAAEGVFEFPANAANCVVTVNPGLAAANVFLVEGAYTLKGEGEDVELALNALSVPASGSLVLENLTLKVDTVSNAVLSRITFGKGGRLALTAVPAWNGTAAINVADVSDLAAGAYELVSWTDKPRSGTTGYGRPNVPEIPGVKEGWQAKLVFRTHGVSLLLRDPAWLARKPLTIWPFGDSITEGMNGNQTHANYRIQLYQKLELLGYNVKAVGFSTRTYTARGAFDPTGADISAQQPDWIRHSGVGGELACHYTSNHGTLHDSWANALDQAGDPDIVLLHIGINDIVSGDANAARRWVETFGSVTNLAANILRERPNAKVVLSSMHRLEWGQTYQTAGNDGNRNYVKPFRDEMVALMAMVEAGEIASLPKGRVFFADMYGNVRPRSYAAFQDDADEEDGLFEGDHIHPNWEGHDRMSDVWLAQVRAAFPDPTDAAREFRSNVSPAPVAPEALGAVRNVPADYLKGFRKATVITPNADGSERADTVSVANVLAGETEVTKVGYYVEYVFPSATTNIHRWVWVDMDALRDGMTVAEAGLPTAKTVQQVVSRLHVASNHLAVHPVAADDDTVKGFVEFSPFTFGGGAKPVADGPDHWMNNTSWNDTFATSGGYGSFQVHRMAPGANPYDPNSVPPAEVLFAYNAWNCGDAKATEFGIGDFNQHLTGFTTDWVNMRNTETMHAGCLTAKSIEIWVKTAEAVPASWNEVTDLAEVPELPAALVAADLATLASWAKANGIAVSDAGAIKPLAFALGCANDDMAIAESAKEFKVKISFDEKGEPVVTTTRAYNLQPVIKGAVKVNGTYSPGLAGKFFFKATLGE